MGRVFALVVGLVLIACSDDRTPFMASTPIVDAGADGGRQEPPSDAALPEGARLKLAFSRFYMGDTDRGGNAMSYAWEYYGEDFDGLHSNYTLNGECLPPPDQPAYAALDGINGYDNVWGARILPSLAKWDPSPSKASDDALKAGARRPMITLGQLGGGLTTATLHASFMYFQDGQTEPELVAYDAATFANNTFDSGPSPAPVMIELPLGPQPLRVTVQRLRVHFDLMPDGKAIGGQLSGAITVADLRAAVVDHVTRSAPSECGGPKIEDLERTIAAAVDVLADGRNDRTAQCDAISFGVGFEAAPMPVTGTRAAAAALTPPCP